MFLNSSNDTKFAFSKLQEIKEEAIKTPEIVQQIVEIKQVMCVQVYSVYWITSGFICNVIMLSCTIRGLSNGLC